MRFSLPVAAVLLLAGCTQPTKIAAPAPEPDRRNIKVNGLEIGVERVAADRWGAWLIGPSLIVPVPSKVRTAERKAVEQASACKVVSGGPGDSPMRLEYVELTVAC